MNKPILSVLATLLTITTVVSAQANELPSRAEMWEMLKKQNQEIQALKSRLGDSEKKVEETVAKVESQSSSSSSSGMKWADRPTIGGTLEMDATRSSSYADVDASDVVVSTAELTFDAVLNDWVTANVTLLHEEDAASSIVLDSASITIANADRTPLYMTIGNITVPFGSYATNLLSDPMTQVLGETAETAVLVGVAGKNLSASVYAFNGSSDSGENEIDQFGASLGFAGSAGALNVEAGAGWINSLNDSDTVQDALSSKSHVPAAEFHASLGFKGLTIIGEYVTALEDFDSTDMTYNGNPARPSAWTTELGYTFNVADKETTIAASYQGSKEALGLSMAEKTILGGLSVNIFENATLAFEWKHDSDYDTTDSAANDGTAITTQTGKSQNTATLRLAVGF
jgi:hypothetical protein